MLLQSMFFSKRVFIWQFDLIFLYRATLPRNVELCMTDVLIQLIEDVGILGQEMTELILEQFDTYDKVKKKAFFM